MQLQDHILPEENLQEKWQKTFPGNSHLTVELRNNVITAESHRNRTRAAFQRFNAELDDTFIPMEHWDRFTLRRYNDICQLAARAQREFVRALRLLQASYKPEPKAPAPPPPPEVYQPRKTTIYQHAEIDIIDGTVRTKCDRRSSWFLDKDLAANFSHVHRHYFFPEKVVPEPYQYVLTHEGVTHPPSLSVYLTYTLDEFLRLCRLETETNSEYLLDGNRTGYKQQN